MKERFDVEIPTTNARTSSNKVFDPRNSTRKGTRKGASGGGRVSRIDVTRDDAELCKFFFLVGSAKLGDEAIAHPSHGEVN